MTRPAPGWIEISAHGPAEAKDIATGVFIAAGSPGVLEENNADAPGKLVLYSRWEDETAEEEDASPVARLKAYLPQGSSASIEELKSRLSRIGWDLSTSWLKETDWAEKWKRGLRPVRVSYKGKTVIIKPTWHKLAKKPGQIIIEMDPGMAFGTGGHSTTKMCVKAIMRLALGKKLPKGPDILDVGTGTGVLAIAAKKLGFKKAVGIDIDRVALTVARKNARMNRTQITVSGKSLEEVPGRFTAVAANILAGELKRLSNELVKRMKPEGYLILSGILSHEAEGVSKTFEGLGLVPSASYLDKEWAALVMRKAAG